MLLENRLKPAPRAKFFFAVSHSGDSLHQPSQQMLAEEFGSLGAPSPVFCFSSFSHYYDEEFGGTTWKYFIPMSGLLSADDLVPVKLAAERIQYALSVERSGRRWRTVNIDPGFVNGWQVVLATVKNHSHRIYLGEGVFCELTLRFADGNWVPLPWTYPDYQTKIATDFFDTLRRENHALSRTMIRK